MEVRQSSMDVSAPFRGEHVRKAFHTFVARRRTGTVLGVILLYLLSVSPHWHISPDSAAYLLLSQSLVAGDGYAICGHPEGKYPPGFPFYLALMTHLGLGKMLPLNLCMCLMALATLACSYRLLREHTPPRSAFLGVIVLAVLYEFYLHSTMQLSDIPFMLLIIAGQWWLIRGLRGGAGWLEAGTLALAVACWIRVLGIPLALGASLGLILQSRGNWQVRIWANGLVLMIGAATAGMWLYARDRAVQAAVPVASYASELSVLAHGGVSQWLVRPIVNLYESGTPLARLFTGQDVATVAAVVVFWLPVLVGAYCSLRKRHYIVLFATAAYLGSILLIRVPLARYFLPVAPVLWMYFAYGLRCLALRAIPRATARAALVSGVVCVLIAFNVPKDVRLAYRIHHPRRIELLGRQDVVNAAEFLRTHCAQERRFVSARYNDILTYLSGISYIPVARDLSRQQSSADALSAFLDGQKVDYIVTWRHPDKVSAVHRRVRELISSDRRYQVAFRHGDIEIFSTQRLPDAAGPRSENTDGRPAGSR